MDTKRWDVTWQKIILCVTKVCYVGSPVIIIIINYYYLNLWAQSRRWWKKSQERLLLKRQQTNLAVSTEKNDTVTINKD